MRRHRSIALVSAVVCIVAASCGRALPDFPANGFLELSSLDCSSVTVLATTRSVDSGLSIEILSSEGTTVKSFPAGSESASSKIELAPGDYSLKAFSTSYGLTPAEGDKGEPSYFIAQEFSVSPARTTYLTVSVPMVNFGVRLSLPEGFADIFDSYAFTVSFGGRTVSLRDGETAYFDLPSDSSVPEYEISVVNNESESFSKVLVHNAGVRAGTVYVVEYSLTAQTLSL